ncbi:MAG: hypothetical protein ACREMZ_16445 [Gemmatimonadales bacterium]
MTHTRLAILLLVPLLGAACAQSEPTAVDSDAPQAGSPAPASYGASVELEEFSFPVHFFVPVACLNGSVLVSGTVYGRDRIVTRPDGSVHVQEKLDVSDVTIALGDQLWTAGPNASEMFLLNFAADGSVRQIEHLGVVIFRAEDGRPELRLVHQIHHVRLPSGEIQLNHQIFGIRCIAPDA